MISNEQVGRWGLITNVILLLSSGVRFLQDLAVSPSGSLMPSGAMRLYTLLFLGVLAAIAGGIMWSWIDARVFGWHIGASGGNKGWPTVAASMSMTIPLSIVPVLYQHFGHTQVLHPRHLVAGGTIIVTNALGWVLIFGWKGVGFRGMKELIEPVPSPAIGRRLMMELVFTAVNFCSIVLVYRAIVDSQSGALSISLIERVLIPAVVYFSGMSIFVVVRPEAREDPTWIQVRGVVGGLLLVITLTGGMLM